ncbi:MAG TPA: adenylyl-sulfate reductase subunit beta [Syntrophobacteraceae bacterium]|nr:adenylyl-sulfate reductase subunit beta [Syntrophobacteraceae bacterium]
MPSYVILERCNGCKGRDRTACTYICPNDLMVLDKEKMKAYNRAPELCWECYNCIKICPQQAMDCRSYADFVPMGASAVPQRASNHILWTVTFRNGTSKHFKFLTRTTPKGRAEPLGGYETGTDDIKSPLLCTEPASTGACELPALEKQP